VVAGILAQPMRLVSARAEVSGSSVPTAVQSASRRDVEACMARLLRSFKASEVRLRGRSDFAVKRT
jgi:hypothetical protein